MPLVLKSVEASRGLRWVRDGFALFSRQPLAFSTLFALFLLTTALAAVVPLLGLVWQAASFPLVSLGFMVAAQAALMGQRVTPLHFIEALRTDPIRRRTLLVLCAMYGTGYILLFLVSNQLSNDAMDRIQLAVSKTQSVDAAFKAMFSILEEPRVMTASWLATGGLLVMSVLFWHAPALVHWGGQGIGQALFSSTVAVWRSRGAFALFGLSWIVLMTGAVFLLLGLLWLLGALALAPTLTTPLTLILFTVYFVSLLFTFNDSFGGSLPAAPPNDPVEPGGP